MITYFHFLRLLLYLWIVCHLFGLLIGSEHDRFQRQASAETSGTSSRTKPENGENVDHVLTAGKQTNSPKSPGGKSAQSPALPASPLGTATESDQLPVGKRATSTKSSKGKSAKSTKSSKGKSAKSTKSSKGKSDKSSWSFAVRKKTISDQLSALNNTNPSEQNMNIPTKQPNLGSEKQAGNKKKGNRKPVKLSDNISAMKMKPGTDEMDFPSEFDCRIDFGDMDFILKATKMNDVGKKATIGEDDFGNIGMRGSKKVETEYYVGEYGIVEMTAIENENGTIEVKTRGIVRPKPGLRCFIDDNSMSDCNNFSMNAILGHDELYMPLDPFADTPSTDTPSTDTPSTDTPSTYTPSTDKPSTYTPSTDTPSTYTPSTYTPSTDTPSTDTPSTDTPSTDTPSTDTPSTDTPSTDTPAESDGTLTRRKRDDGPLSQEDFKSKKVVEILYLVDKAMMDWFLDRNDDEASAIEEMKSYITLTNNEGTHMYASVQERSNGTLDIHMGVADILYPTPGTEWSWLSEWIVNGYLVATIPGRMGALWSLSHWVDEGNLDNYKWDVVSLISGLDISFTSDGLGGKTLLGVAFMKTVCSNKKKFKVLINEDLDDDVTFTLVHELAHSLGANHDSLDNTCDGKTHLMAPRLIFPDSSNRHTYRTFSSCSVAQFKAHLQAHANCLNDHNETKFLENLCQGLRGEKYGLDHQCQKNTNNPNSRLCAPSSSVSSGKVPSQACWDDNQVYCTEANGLCNRVRYNVYDGTPCVGQDSVTDYVSCEVVCYRGSCRVKFDLCDKRDIATSTPKTTTATEPPPTTTEPPPPSTESTSSTAVPTTTLTTTPSSCDCLKIHKNNYGIRKQGRCCRRNKNVDGSCCSGCKMRNKNNRCKRIRM